MAVRTEASWRSPAVFVINNTSTMACVLMGPNCQRQGTVVSRLQPGPVKNGYHNRITVSPGVCFEGGKYQIRSELNCTECTHMRNNSEA